MQLKQVKIWANKIDTFTNKYTDAQPSVSCQKEIRGLLGKNDFKIVTSNKVIMHEEVLSIT